MKGDHILNIQGHYLEEYDIMLGGDAEKEEMVNIYFCFYFYAMRNNLHIRWWQWKSVI